MSDFRVGSVIANALNPRENEFLCGSVRDVSQDEYILWYPDDILLSIKKNDAVALREVLNAHTDDVSLVADRRYLNGDKKLFVGGKKLGVAYGSAPDAHCCVVLSEGKRFHIEHRDVISAVEALCILEPCPHSQNR